MERTSAVEPSRPTDVTLERGGRSPRSFDAFYEEAYASMVRLAWSLVDSREAAEEAVQDAFAAMYARFDGIENPSGYLRSCFANNCRNILRRRRVVRRHTAGEVELATDDVYDHLFDVLRRLPERSRTVVVLRYQAGLSEAEIAATLGIAPGTVKSRLSRAKELLRKEIGR